MKARALVFVAGLTSLFSAGCMSQPGSAPRAPQAALDVRPRFEEMGAEVPAAFKEAAKWNQKKKCPEEAELTAFTRYRFEAGENAQGFKYYYGRSCQIIRKNEPEAESRKLASVGGTAEQPSPTLIPHGPYTWWYENGELMESGAFDHGTLAQGSIKYDPNGAVHLPNVIAHPKTGEMIQDE